MQAVKNKIIIFFIVFCIFPQEHNVIIHPAIKLEETNLTKKPDILIKFAPFSVLIGSAPLSAEYRLHIELPIRFWASYEIALAYLSKPLYWNSFAEMMAEMDTTLSQQSKQYLTNIFKKLEFRGARIMVMYRYYFGGKSLQEFFTQPINYSGPYLSFLISFTNFSIMPGWNPLARSSEKLTFMQANGGFLLGFQLVLINYFVFDVSGGLGYKQNYVKSTFMQPVNFANPDPFLRYYLYSNLKIYIFGKIGFVIYKK